jgi:hypothetical protein
MMQTLKLEFPKKKNPTNPSKDATLPRTQDSE